MMVYIKSVAEVAELVDALDSGSSEGSLVLVRFQSSAPLKIGNRPISLQTGRFLFLIPPPLLYPFQVVHKLCHNSGQPMAHSTHLHQVNQTYYIKCRIQPVYRIASESFILYFNRIVARWKQLVYNSFLWPGIHISIK